MATSVENRRAFHEARRQSAPDKRTQLNLLYLELLAAAHDRGRRVRNLDVVLDQVMREVAALTRQVRRGGLT